MSHEEISALQNRVANYDDQHALEKLYLYFYPRLHRFGKSLVKAAEIAEELVEDVFIRLWEKRAGLTDVRNLQVYLYVAVRNRALNYLDWKSKDIVAYFEAYPCDAASSNDSPDHLLITREMSVRISQAVETLPPKCKIIFKLVREEGLKYREVADILGISSRTVDTQMTIALKKIASAITLYTVPAH